MTDIRKTVMLVKTGRCDSWPVSINWPSSKANVAFTGKFYFNYGNIVAVTLIQLFDFG